MNKRAFYNMILCGLFSLLSPFFVNAQGEIAFTNKVTYTKTGSIIGVRLVSLMPAPVTNEYQEINELSSNCGNFIDVNVANKVLFYDGSFSNNSFDVAESFKYKVGLFKLISTNQDIRMKLQALTRMNTSVAMAHISI